MSDDLWWAFIAGIDKQQLLQEVPGSATDRRMRERHAEHVARINAERARRGLTTAPIDAADETEEIGRKRLEAARREAFPNNRKKRKASA